MPFSLNISVFCSRRGTLKSDENLLQENGTRNWEGEEGDWETAEGVEETNGKGDGRDRNQKSEKWRLRLNRQGEWD